MGILLTLVDLTWGRLLWATGHRRYMRYKLWWLAKVGVNLRGKPRYVSPFVDLDGAHHSSLITLGDNCVLTHDVRILTHDFAVYHALVAVGKRDRNGPEVRRIGAVDVGDNVFVGSRAIILPGVTIGKNSIIGAGSVVSRSIPAGSVAAGVPARVVCTIEEYAERAANLQLEEQNW